MSKYYTSVYKNYFEKLDGIKSINSINDTMDNLNTYLNNYISNIESSSWNEAGKTELLTSFIPKIKVMNQELKNSVSNNLSEVLKIVQNKLYPLLLELKNKDEDYNELQDKIKNGKIDDDELTSTKNKMTSLDKNMLDLINNIDKKIIEIKKYDNNNEVVAGSASINETNSKGTDEAALKRLKELMSLENEADTFIDKLKLKVEENKLRREIGYDNIRNSSGNNNGNNNSKDQTINSKTVNISLQGSNWNVVDTKLSATEYAAVAYNKGIRQNSDTGRYGDYCLAFSYVHASNMYNGSTADNAESAFNWAHAAEFSDYFNDNKNETLGVVFDQIMEGKPVVMQVNGNKNGTSRHFVTVVGVKDNVKNRNNIQESDLLILDSWDGKLERMDESTSRFMTTGKQTNKSYSGYYLRLLK